MAETIVKHPDENRGHSVNFTGALDTGRSVSSGTVVATKFQDFEGSPLGEVTATSDVISGSASVSSNKVQFTLTGGTHGIIYRLKVTGVLDNGDDLVENLFMRVDSEV